MATKASTIFPRSPGEVTRADLNKSVSDLTNMIAALEAGVNELKSKSDTLIIGEGNELPIDGENFRVFRLTEHPKLPGGLYYFDDLWIQV